MKTRIFPYNRPSVQKLLSAYLFFLLVPVCFISSAQNPTLDIGLRLQKTVNLYYENGFTVQYSNDDFLSKRLFLGVSFVSSRLGSAFESNAIKQDNFIISTTYFFRPPRRIKPFIRFNTGYFYADYEEKIFDDLPNSSFLLSPEAGISFWTELPLKIGASAGYNLLTGNGIKGPGTLYPLFIQTSITWDILKRE